MNQPMDYTDPTYKQEYTEEMYDNDRKQFVIKQYSQKDGGYSKLRDFVFFGVIGGLGLLVWQMNNTQITMTEQIRQLKEIVKILASKEGINIP